MASDKQDAYMARIMVSHTEIIGKVLDVHTLKPGDVFTLYETDNVWWTKLVLKVFPYKTWRHLPHFLFQEKRTGRKTEYTIQE